MKEITRSLQFPQPAALPSNESSPVGVVDMTSVLAMESWVSQKDGAPHGEPDPAGEQCLADYVDTMVYATKRRLLVPERDEYTAVSPLLQRLPRMKAFPIGAITLTSDEEARLVEAFCLNLDCLGNALAPWWRSQMTNKSVATYRHKHFDRSGREVSSASRRSWHVWRQHGGQKIATRRGPFSFVPPTDELMRREIDNVGLSMYQHAYLFEIFMRGLLYSKATHSRTGPPIIHSAHPIRNITMGGQSGRWFQNLREWRISWGCCIVDAIKDSHDPIGAERFAEIVHSLVASSEARSLTMPNLWDVDIDAPEAKRQLRDLIERAEQIGVSAGIPRQMLRPGLTVKAAKVGGELLLDFLEHRSLAIIVNEVTKQPALLPLRWRAIETLKSVFNYVRPGTFGYARLVGQLLRERVAPSSVVN